MKVHDDIKRFEQDIELKEYVEYKISRLEKYMFSIGFFFGFLFTVASIGIGKFYFGGK